MNKQTNQQMNMNEWTNEQNTIFTTRVHHEKTQFMYNGERAKAHITWNHTNMYMYRFAYMYASLSFPEGKIHVAIDSYFLYILMYSMSFNSTDISSGNL